MAILRDPASFRCGLYVVTFAAEEAAVAFAQRYAACPSWPVVAAGPGANEVLILALEPRCQCHGDFSQEHNDLVEHPEYLGAEAVRFRRDDTLIALFPNHALVTGTAEDPPCGSHCARCPSYRSPCQGCPATWRDLP